MLKRSKPRTPGQRHRVRMKVDTEGGSTEVPLSRREVKKGTGGRNQSGRITVHHRGGGVKRRLRQRVNGGQEAGVGVVRGIQYDPNRTCRIALIHYADGEKRFILSPDGLKVGGTVVSGADASPEVGNSLPLSAIPLSTTVHH